LQFTGMTTLLCLLQSHVLLSVISFATQALMLLSSSTDCYLFLLYLYNLLLSPLQWIDALILSVQLVAVPNTQLTQRKHTVAYYAPGADTETVLNSVPSDRLRLPKEVKEAKPVREVKPPPPPDEHTGYGGWQTVSI
jgi:hypothetical protein